MKIYLFVGFDKHDKVVKSRVRGVNIAPPVTSVEFSQMKKNPDVVRVEVYGPLDISQENMHSVNVLVPEHWAYEGLA